MSYQKNKQKRNCMFFTVLSYSHNTSKCLFSLFNERMNSRATCNRGRSVTRVSQREANRDLLAGCPPPSISFSMFTRDGWLGDGQNANKLCKQHFDKPTWQQLQTKWATSASKLMILLNKRGRYSVFHIRERVGEEKRGLLRVSLRVRQGLSLRDKVEK